MVRRGACAVTRIPHLLLNFGRRIMLTKGSIVVLVTVILSGCVGLQIDKEIDNY